MSVLWAYTFAVLALAFVLVVVGTWPDIPMAFMAAMGGP